MNPERTRAKGRLPWVMGISSSHNGAVCLLHGDTIAVAIQEERLTRQKRAEHPAGVTSLAIRYCLDYVQIKPAELDAVVVCAAGSAKPRTEDVDINRILQVRRNGVQTSYIPHHLGHAIGAFATSGFEDATVVVIDGGGSPWDELTEAEKTVAGEEQYRFWATPGASEPRETVSIYTADSSAVTPVHKLVASYTPEPVPRMGMQLFASLGDMYGEVSRQIFGSFLDGSGKTMGLAPFGRPRFPPGMFFDYMDGFIRFKSEIPDLFKEKARWPERKKDYEDLAASTQKALECGVARIVELARKKGRSNNLCYAGGVALNSMANEVIVRAGQFRQVFVMPAAEDSGTAIGAAYHGLWSLEGITPRQRTFVDSLGRNYSPEEVTAAIIPEATAVVEEAGEVISRASALLDEGKVVGWFQGGSELGPRALGCRSILSDPRRAEIKDHLNLGVKGRESFRPFAPCVLAEHAAEWFSVQPGFEESPYMLRVMTVKAEKQGLIPAVVHVDGTARVQTIDSESPLPLRKLLEEFYRRTGVPVLLNTSFNVAGEPIVETPRDAVHCFLLSGIDACVLNGILLYKEDDWDVFSLIPIVSIEYLVSPTQKCDGDSAKSISCIDLGVPGFSVAADLLWFGELPQMPPAHFAAIARSSWGPVVHAFPSGFKELLSRMDGKASLREIYEQVNQDEPMLTEMVFTKLVSVLTRAGVVRYERVKKR